MSGITKAERARRGHAALVKRVRAREAAGREAADRISGILAEDFVEADPYGYVVLTFEQAARLADLVEGAD